MRPAPAFFTFAGLGHIDPLSQTATVTPGQLCCFGTPSGGLYEKRKELAMSAFNVAVIAGDGIGPEVIDQAIRVAEATLKNGEGRINWTRLPWSCGFYKQHGRMMPADGFDQLAKFDAILFGAVGSPDVPDHLSVNQLLLPMRRRFDQYVNLRPAYLYDGVQSPLRDKAPGSIDMLVYRENTEGEYAPVGGKLYQSTANEIAVQTAVFTRRGCERIMR